MPGRAGALFPAIGAATLERAAQAAKVQHAQSLHVHRHGAAALLITLNGFKGHTQQVGHLALREPHFPPGRATYPACARHGAPPAVQTWFFSCLGLALPVCFGLRFSAFPFRNFAGHFVSSGQQIKPILKRFLHLIILKVYNTPHYERQVYNEKHAKQQLRHNFRPSKKCDKFHELLVFEH
jgi:hypothetical protein